MTIASRVFSVIIFSDIAPNMHRHFSKIIFFQKTFINLIIFIIHLASLYLYPYSTSFSFSGSQYEGECNAFFQSPIPVILNTKQQQQQSNKQVLPAESGGQEAIRSSICFAHQHKEAVDSLATPTLCPSAHQSFADTKRKVTCSSNGQRKQRADPRLPICSN